MPDYMKHLGRSGVELGNGLVSKERRNALYASAKAQYGDTFSNHYHNFSEGLFLSASAFLKPGDVAIDAGCYLADNALKMAEFVGDAGTVFTFEPDPRMFSKASVKIEGSPHVRSVRLSSVALSSEPGKTEFVIVNELEGHSGLRVKAHYGREVTTRRVTVTVTTLDGFLSDQGMQPSRVRLIKFDLEGGELNAFQGARETLKAGRPLVLFEYGNLNVYGHTPADFIAFFGRHGYRIFDCFGQHLATVEDLNATPGWNLFAVPDLEAREFLLGLIEPKLKAFLTPARAGTR